MANNPIPAVSPTDCPISLPEEEGGRAPGRCLVPRKVIPSPLPHYGRGSCGRGGEEVTQNFVWERGGELRLVFNTEQILTNTPSTTPDWCTLLVPRKKESSAESPVPQPGPGGGGGSGQPAESGREGRGCRRSRRRNWFLTADPFRGPATAGYCGYRVNINYITFLLCDYATNKLSYYADN